MESRPFEFFIVLNQTFDARELASELNATLAQAHRNKRGRIMIKVEKLEGSYNAYVLKEITKG